MAKDCLGLLIALITKFGHPLHALIFQQYMLINACVPQLLGNESVVLSSGWQQYTHIDIQKVIHIQY